MADATTLNVLVKKATSETLSNGMVLWRKAVTITISDLGTKAADKKIPVAAFGLSTLDNVTPFVSSEDDEIIPAGISCNRLYVLLQTSNANAPASYSGTYNIVVRGYA